MTYAIIEEVEGSHEGGCLSFYYRITYFLMNISFLDFHLDKGKVDFFLGVIKWQQKSEKIEEAKGSFGQA
ncbi:hypothetical protein [Gracilibacillus dipsosauri]|uniref:hypothetical protein n=1 Tax=Gracilibacillus dipsosauri TaxID=178340 RepID=UPI00240A1674